MQLCCMQDWKHILGVRYQRIYWDIYKASLESMTFKEVIETPFII
jgi:hypothetical protein